MGLGGRGVKPRPVDPEAPDPAAPALVEGARRRMVWPPPGRCQTGAVRGAVCAESDRAGLDEQDEGRADEPAEQGELDRCRRCRGARQDQVEQDAERRRDRRLDQPQQRSRRRGCSPSQTARRPCSARMRVTSSAYSRSPPTGSPRAIRVTEPTTAPAVRPGTSPSLRPRGSGWWRGSPPRTARPRARPRRHGRGARGCAAAPDRCRRSARWRRGGRGRGP